MSETKLAAEAWISVEDRLPEVDGRMHNYLVWCKCGNRQGGYRDLAAYGTYRCFSEDSSGELDDEGLNYTAFGWNKEEETHGGEYDSMIFNLDSKVAHWRPLPSPPEAPTKIQP